MSRATGRLAFIVVPLAFLAACSGGGQEATVTKSDMGAEWPLTVDEGTLQCEGSGGVGQVTIEVDGTTYAVNGSAKGNEANEAIDPIWADGTTPGLKKDIGPLIQEGLRLCK